MNHNSALLKNLKLVKVIKIVYKNGFIYAIRRDGNIEYWINPENYGRSYKFFKEKDNFDNIEMLRNHIVELIKNKTFTMAIDNILENATNKEEEVCNKIAIVVPIIESEDDIDNILRNLKLEELDAFTFDFMNGLMIIMLDGLTVTNNWIYKNSNEMCYIYGEMKESTSIRSEIKDVLSGVKSGYLEELVEMELEDILEL